MAGSIVCPRCDESLTPGEIHDGEVKCRSCGGSFQLLTFKPAGRRGARATQAGLTPDATAVCGNHPRNVAAHACSRCGVFICSLCAIDTDGMTLCPGCYDRLSSEGVLESTRMKFRDMGRLASTAALAGILLWVFCLITGPMAIGYGVKALKQRNEVGELHARWRIWLAIGLGAIETVGGLAFIAFLIFAWTK